MRQKKCALVNSRVLPSLQGETETEQTASQTREYTPSTTAPPYLVFLAIHFKHRDGAFTIDLITRWVFPHAFSLQENGIRIRETNRPQQDCCSRGKMNHRSNLVSGDDR